MRAWVCGFAAVALLSAQEKPRLKPAPKAEKTVEELEAEKRDPKKRAEALLEGAAQAVGAAQPQVQVVGLLHLADNYQVFDKKKAMEYFHQAFAIAAGLQSDADADARGLLQTEIITKMADADLGEAIVMLRQTEAAGDSDPRITAAEKIVQVLLQKKDVDTAIGIVDSFATSTDYPYRAAGSIFRALPADDARRNTIFGSAIAAYAAHPRGAFADLLVRCWEQVPRPMAESAMTTLLNGILDRKDNDGSQTESLSSAKGNVTFSSRKDSELFGLMHIVLALDPKRAQEILESRPSLKAAVDQFPLGPESMQDDKGGVSRNIRRGGGPDPEQEAQQRLWALSNTRVSSAMAALSEDPQKALSIAKTIPIAQQKAEVLGSVARAVAEKDPALAKGVLSQCIALLDDVKAPMIRVESWNTVAEAAHKIKDDDLAWQAIGRGLADATALYKQDSDAEQPNSALREYWPSTQSYRRIVITAAKLFGVDAEPLLLKIADPDLALLARIELAQALLKRPHNDWNVRVSRRKA